MGRNLPIGEKKPSQALVHQKEKPAQKCVVVWLTEHTWLIRLQVINMKVLHTRMSSKSVPWSTLRNSASHELISSVLFSLFSSSSGGGGSSLWYVHHWITFFRMAAFTLGRGTASSSSSSIPRSIEKEHIYCRVFMQRGVEWIKMKLETIFFKNLTEKRKDTFLILLIDLEGKEQAVYPTCSQNLVDYLGGARGVLVFFLPTLHSTLRVKSSTPMS